MTKSALFLMRFLLDLNHGILSYSGLRSLSCLRSNIDEMVSKLGILVAELKYLSKSCAEISEIYAQNPFIYILPFNLIILLTQLS